MNTHKPLSADDCYMLLLRGQGRCIACGKQKEFSASELCMNCRWAWHGSREGLRWDFWLAERQKAMGLF